MAVAHTLLFSLLAVDTICSVYDKLSETEALSMLKKKILKGEENICVFFLMLCQTGVKSKKKHIFTLAMLIKH